LGIRVNTTTVFTCKEASKSLTLNEDRLEIHMQREEGARACFLASIEPGHP
jgi:hypothetical protein